MALYYGKHRVCPTIGGGVTPTGTITVTENGIYNITNYANTDVKVYTVPREVDENGVYRTISASTYTLPSEIHDLGNEVLLYGFYGCNNLVSVDFSSLTSISGSFALENCFSNCTSLQTISFSSLNSNSFGSYTNQFSSMLSGVTDCTVHFPSNLQSVIGSWSDVTSGFGGTNTTVLFDLPATT